MHFRVWAPSVGQVAVVIEDATPAPEHDLARDEPGYFAGFVEEARVGTRYRFRLDRGETFPDPASRYQPEGPHGPSMVVDPLAFEWTDGAWTGVARSGLVLYEMHVGTFTPEGMWRAAIAELPSLIELGITALEVMPVADFPGRFGWGYDGVHVFAPARQYGSPDDFRSFVDAAHGLGLAVILDVVYNHLGPDGCWLDRFSRHYFAERTNEWGRSIDFDGPESGPVREFYRTNAACWIQEFHLDGLRLDATQAIHDRSEPHIITEIVAAVHAAAGGRPTWIVAENEPQHTIQMRPQSEGGYGIDAMWNDDFHHSAVVALTGRREAYYSDYFGRPQEIISAAKHGFLYQGQWYSWQQKPRGTPAAGLLPESFVCFLENHDQVANSWNGARLHALTSPGRLRAMTAVLLLGPWTPMLFQGQEFASTRPFLYFADHHDDLASKVRQGRRDFLTQFSSVAHAEIDQHLPDPTSPDTFARCVLDPVERERHAAAVALHASLLQMRAAEPAFRAQGRYGFEGAVLGEHAFATRFFGEPYPDGHDERLLLVNLGVQLELRSMPDPIFAPPLGLAWVIAWSSEDPLYGGRGTPDVVLRDGWRLPAESAIVLRPVARRA